MYKQLALYMVEMFHPFKNMKWNRIFTIIKETYKSKYLLKALPWKKHIATYEVNNTLLFSLFLNKHDHSFIVEEAHNKNCYFFY